MNAVRVKVLAAFLAGMLCTLGVLTARNFVLLINERFDRIEQYLSSHPIPQFVVPQSQKGALSQPQQWKV